MNHGYDKALYRLPFDHRHSWVKSLCSLDPPLCRRQSRPAAGTSFVSPMPTTSKRSSAACKLSWTRRTDRRC